MPVLLDAHGHFAQGVGAAGDGVDGVLLQLRLAAHHIGDDVEQGVHRPHAEARAALFHAVHIHEHRGRGRHAPGIRALHADVPQAQAVRDPVDFLLDQGHEVVVVQSFFAVGQLLHGLKDQVELLVVQLVAHALELVAHGVAARMLADDQIALGAAHGLRGHDFIRLAVLEHAVLMDARLVRKGIGPHNGFVVGNGLADDHGKQATGRIELLGFDAVLQAVVVPAHAQGHGDFL